MMASTLNPELCDSWGGMEKDVYKSLLAEYPASQMELPDPWNLPLPFGILIQCPSGRGVLPTSQMRSKTQRRAALWLRLGSGCAGVTSHGSPRAPAFSSGDWAPVFVTTVTVLQGASHGYVMVRMLLFMTGIPVASVQWPPFTGLHTAQGSGVGGRWRGWHMEATREQVWSESRGFSTGGNELRTWLLVPVLAVWPWTWHLSSCSLSFSTLY